MRLEVFIDSHNDAMTTLADLQALLIRVSEKLILAGVDSRHKIQDANGNTVGYYVVSGDPEEDEW